MPHSGGCDGMSKAPSLEQMLVSLSLENPKSLPQRLSHEHLPDSGPTCAATLKSEPAFPTTNCQTKTASPTNCWTCRDRTRWCFTFRAGGDPKEHRFLRHRVEIDSGNLGAGMSRQGRHRKGISGHGHLLHD